MSNYECTEERFLRDVASHRMLIVRDEGIHRHLRFKQEGSSNMYFDLITWPGHLCYTGDMGTFVFQRLEDMFCFFRMDARDKRITADKILIINTGYWGEKCVAVDSCDGIRKYSPDAFRDAINEQLEYWLEDLDAEDDAECIAGLKEAVAENLLPYADEGEHEARDAANRFHFKHNDDEFEITDFWERSLQVKSFRFIWCCYALAWGIDQYDKSKAESV